VRLTWRAPEQVLVEDPKELEKIRDRESDITKERIQKVPSLTLSSLGCGHIQRIHHAKRTCSADIHCWYMSLRGMSVEVLRLILTIHVHGQVLAAGANVVLTTKGIDDMSLKYFVEAGAIACRRVPKEDLRCENPAKPHAPAVCAAKIVAHAHGHRHACAG
jgi:chaperonin GroEL (HSP60 family)